MLRDHAAVATVAVRDLSAAHRFYSDVLGLKRREGDNSQAISYDTGNTTMLVYKSQFAGTNKGTAVNWPVGKDFDAIIESLRSHGVRFEHYDVPGMERDGDIHKAMGMRAVWFMDPDGNIHSIMDT
jgi:catechol 2,3-dioxygenase-like lactoylglutathione lyase family enzyme